MNSSDYNMQNQQNLEYSPTIDDFFKVRQKGSKHWILKHVLYKSNKFFFIFWLILIILATVSFSTSKIFLGKNIDSFSSGVDKIDWILFIIFLILTLSAPILELMANWVREVLAQRMERDTRDELYLNLLGKSQSFHDAQRLGDLMARTTNDVRQLNYLISPALTLIFQALSEILITIMIIAINYPIQLIICPIIFSVLFIFALRNYVKKFGPVTKQKQVEYGNLNAVLNESLSGIEVVKGMAQENRSLKKYQKQAKKNLELGVKEGTIQAHYIPSFMVAVTIVFSLIHSVLLYYEGMFTIGGIIAYMVLINNFFFPTSVSVWAWAVYSRAIAGADRILEIMNQTSEIGENINPVIKGIDGEVEFQNVSFHYPGTKNKVLKNLSFKIKKGQTVAIVGTTGSGKTTCTKLISRLYDVTNGKILVDGKDVKGYSLHSLRNQIAYIEQDVFLFSKSIIDNISFGRESNKEEIIKAAKNAQAHDFIMELPEGYDTTVGERGVKLSGGERQRIAIARAFLSNPKILILDDSTSAIDSATEEKIQLAISNILKGRTTFLITHRLSQIRWSDLIIVFKQGNIMAQGSHFDLLETSEEYRKIFLTRFDKTIDELLEGKV